MRFLLTIPVEPEIEVQLVMVMTVIANRSPDCARFLAAEGAPLWVRERLAAPRKTTENVKHLIALVTDLLLRVPDCCADLLDVCAVVASFFEAGLLDLKESVLRWFMVVAYVVAESDFQAVLSYFGPLLGCPSRISRDDLGIYFDALRRIFAAHEAREVVLEATADGELAEFLEAVAAEGDELAENAAALLEVLRATCDHE
jgi:hypothetical protein